MGEKEALEVLKKQGMTQSEAEGFVAGVKKGIQARKEGRVKKWAEISAELMGGNCTECDKKRAE